MSPPPLEPHNHTQTHLKLSGQLPLLAQFFADLRTAKSLKTLWIRTLLSLESLTCRSSSRKWPKSPPKSDFRLKQVALFVLARLARLWTTKHALVDFDLAHAFLAQRMDWSGVLSGITLHSTQMHSSSFFQILPRAQSRSVALSGWLAKPEDWLNERMKISSSHTCLINLKLRGNGY